MNELNHNTLRSDIYLLLSELLRHAPNSEMTVFLKTLEIESAPSAMEQAWVAIKQQANESNQDDLIDEYQNLFIGIGRGEVVPFASWHITGSLMEKPLASLRQDLKLIGISRQDSTKEPEDHIAALCEVMAMLTSESEELQQAIFNKHIANWFGSLVKQIEQATHAKFYLAVAQLMDAFFNLEQVKFSQNQTRSNNPVKIDVKNIIDSVEG